MAIEVDPEWWKSLFDEVYLVTDSRSVGDGAVTRREVDICCELLPLRREDRILDLCGGHGRHSLEFSRRGFGGCTVLDYSQVLIEHGKIVADDLGCEVDFLQGEAGDTGLPGRHRLTHRLKSYVHDLRPAVPGAQYYFFQMR